VQCIWYRSTSLSLNTANWHKTESDYRCATLWVMFCKLSSSNMVPHLSWCEHHDCYLYGTTKIDEVSRILFIYPYNINFKTQIQEQKILRCLQGSWAIFSVWCLVSKSRSRTNGLSLIIHGLESQGLSRPGICDHLKSFLTLDHK